MPIISLENVTFSYDEKVDVIKNLTLSIEQGEYVCIIGHNGSGKSTLARLFNGLNLPKSGKVEVNGLDTSEKKNTFEVRKTVGVVFQNPDNQLVASIVEDDVAFGPENLGIKREEIGERIEYALSAVDMLEFRKASPERLSGGQKQRIAIAGVLALKPQVIILDESTSMLDPEGREEVLKAVRKLNKEQGVTVVAITHYMEEVLDANRVIALQNGEIAFSGTPREVFSDEHRLKSAGLELPLLTYIASKLKEQGLELDGTPLTEDELVEELCALKRKI